MESTIMRDTIFEMISDSIPSWDDDTLARFNREADAELRSRSECGRPTVAPIPDRFDMAEIAQRYFCKTGMAAEVGVYDGSFSAQNLLRWDGSYVMVDTWAHRPGDGQDKNMEDEGEWMRIMAAAVENTRFAASRRIIVRGYSVDMAESFEDNSFDWIYIDAGHDLKNISADLAAWWPKLRRGGLFSGDDYGQHVDTEELRPLTIARVSSVDATLAGICKAYQWATAQALHSFCERYGQESHATWLNDKSNAAWYIIKK